MLILGKYIHDAESPVFSSLLQSIPVYLWNSNFTKRESTRNNSILVQTCKYILILMINV